MSVVVMTLMGGPPRRVDQEWAAAPVGRSNDVGRPSAGLNPLTPEPKDSRRAEHRGRLARPGQFRYSGSFVRGYTERTDRYGNLSQESLPSLVGPALARPEQSPSRA